MSSSNLSRRDFVAKSSFALGAAGSSLAFALPARRMEELAMVYEEFIGQPVNEVPTPALLIELDIFEKNMATMRDACAARGRNCRPHGKVHKSPIIAKKQLEYGARGQCAAKLGEAEVLVHGGIKDVLITAPVVGPRKIQRLLSLQAITPEVKVVVDLPDNIRN